MFFEITVEKVNKWKHKRDTASLSRACSSKKSAVRFEALKALMDLKSDGIADALRKALHDPEAHIRSFSMKALCDIGGKAVLEALIDALDYDSDERVRLLAIETLAANDISGTTTVRLKVE